MNIFYHGNCLTELANIPDASIDSIVTDPPYGLSNTDPAHVMAALSRWFAGERDYLPPGKGFMGNAWDAFVPPPAVWDECMRVLKPGGHLLCFAGSRTVDLMGLSIRLAGFEIRDGIQWLYGSGFPKSQNVAKAITGTQMGYGANSGAIRRATMGDDYTASGVRGNRDGVTHRSDTGMKDRDLTLTPEAEQWEGWGTALKPGHEPIVVARKPLIGTVASNVLQHGTGALNIDGCRVGRPEGDRTDYGLDKHLPHANTTTSLGKFAEVTPYIPSEGGRWPANVVMDEATAAELDQQSGTLVSGSWDGRRNGTKTTDTYNSFQGGQEKPRVGDSGGASRFFYCAKAGKGERPVVDGVAHPTVKPLALMRWLCSLVTPPGGTVLDPFAGSGTTIEAALLEGFQCQAIENDEKFIPLIKARIERTQKEGE